MPIDYTTVVPDSGPKKAKIIIVGEAPGEDEIREKIPFIGATGRILRETILRPAGFDPWKDVYYTNVCQRLPHYKWRPGFDDIKANIVGLRQRLRDIEAPLIVPVGDTALQALSVFKYKDILKYRGSILNARLLNRKMVPMVHPSHAVQGNYEFIHVTKTDAERVFLEAQTPEISLPRRNHNVLYDFNQALAILRSLRDSEYLAFDVETNFPCLGFAPDPFNSYTIPFDTMDHPKWTQEQRSLLLSAVRELFCFSQVKFITQNGLFDKHVLWEDYGIDPFSWEIYADTMYQHQLLYPELPHTLAFINSIYTREPFYKDEGRRFRRGIDPEIELFRYNGKDCCVTLESFLLMDQELQEFGQYDYFYHNIMPLVPVLYRMFRRGIRVDPAQLARTVRDLKRVEKIDRIMLQREVGWEPNPRSYLDMEQFYLSLGIPRNEIRRTPTGRPKCDEAELNRLYTKFGRKEIKRVMHLHSTLTFQSGFTNLELGPDGRYHAIFKLGPTSGRLASEGPGRGKRKGPQLQNIPLLGIANMRKPFVPADGFIFLEGDLEQADARALAYAAPEPLLIQLFESEDSDIHSQICSILTGIPRPLIGKTGPYAKHRQGFKKFIHAVDYGMKPARCFEIMREEEIDCSLDDAKRWVAYYLERFSGIPKYWAWVEEEIKTKRLLVDLLGRKYLFLGRFDHETFKSGYARIPSGTVAGVANLALIRLQALIEKADFEMYIISQVHDSIKTEVPIDRVEEATSLMDQAFDIPLEAHGRSFKIPVEYKTGFSWGDLTHYENTRRVS